MFHQWVSVIQPTEQINPAGDPNFAVDSTDLYQPRPDGGYLVNSTAVTEYYRLRVDTLALRPDRRRLRNHGCQPVDESSNQPLAHDAYAVRVVPSGGLCTGCTVSAMNDMTVYTPVQGGTCQNFEIPSSTSTLIRGSDHHRGSLRRRRRRRRRGVCRNC